MEILGKLLGSPARIKIMRLFLLNKGKIFDIKEIEKRSLVKAPAIRKELKLLSSVDFIKKRQSGYYFNSTFKYEKEFESLLVSSDSLNTDTIPLLFKKVGKIKLLLVSGVFIKNKDSRIDLLIVGDKMRRSKIEEGVKKLEAEIGIEITYAIFEYKEFIYRLSMYDKLVRDILDFPHKIIIQAKDLSTQTLKKI
ncbi:MAG: hypothetical protein WC011_02840 [Candidatus Paceibacterota bacterium]